MDILREVNYVRNLLDNDLDSMRLTSDSDELNNKYRSAKKNLEKLRSLNETRIDDFRKLGVVCNAKVC